MSETSFSRNYIKDSMTQLLPETLTFGNTDDQISVQVDLRGNNGVVFTPSSFLLAPQGSMTVVVSFDMVQINQLPEGTSTFQSTISLVAANTVTGGATQPTTEPPVVPNTPVVTTPPVIPSVAPDINPISQFPLSELGRGAFE